MEREDGERVEEGVVMVYFRVGVSNGCDGEAKLVEPLRGCRGKKDVFVDDTYGNASEANILLSSSVDDCKARDVDALGEDVAGHVGNKRDGGVYSGRRIKFDTMDRLIVAVVNVSAFICRRC